MATEIATLGGGCFWCIEAVFEEMEGVKQVVSGYSGGHVDNPSYEEVCRGTTGHAEVVQLHFDPEVTSYREILQVFFTVHDPTTKDRQGNDVGPQYRSAVYFHSAEQETAVREVIAEMEEADIWDAPFVTEIAHFDTFWEAEEKHQSYYRRNSTQPYCMLVVRPKVVKFRQKFAHKLRA